MIIGDTLTIIVKNYEQITHITQYFSILGTLTAIFISSYTLYKTFIQGPNIRIISKSNKSITYHDLCNNKISNYLFIVNSGSNDGFFDDIKINSIKEKKYGKNLINDFLFDSQNSYSGPIFIKKGDVFKFEFSLTHNRIAILPKKINKIIVGFKYFYESKHNIKERKCNIIFKVVI